MKRLLRVLLVAVLVGCSEKEQSRASIGVILSARPMQGGFGGCDKTVIQTEKVSLVIFGMPVIPNGAEGVLVKYEVYCLGAGDPMIRFTWSGSATEYTVCR
jgi:hypothetical protein